jgi:hypothetical protein
VEEITGSELMLAGQFSGENPLLYNLHKPMCIAEKIIKLVSQWLSGFKQDISTYCFAAKDFSSTFALRFGGRGLVKRIKK